jgi:hypothetical protein
MMFSSGLGYPRSDAVGNCFRKLLLGVFIGNPLELLGIGHKA